MKERISEAEQLQLIGLLALAAHHNTALEDIKLAALALLGITDADESPFSNPPDHVSDAVYGNTAHGELLKRLGVAVSQGESPAP